MPYFLGYTDRALAWMLEFLLAWPLPLPSLEAPDTVALFIEQLNAVSKLVLKVLISCMTIEVHECLIIKLWEVDGMWIIISIWMM